MNTSITKQDLLDAIGYIKNNADSTQRAVGFLYKLAQRIRKEYPMQYPKGLTPLIYDIEYCVEIDDDEAYITLLNKIKEIINNNVFENEKEKNKFLCNLGNIFNNCFDFLINKFPYRENWIQKCGFVLPDIFTIEVGNTGDYWAYFKLCGMNAVCYFEHTHEQECPGMGSWDEYGFDYTGKYINHIKIELLEDYNLKKNIDFFQKLFHYYRFGNCFFLESDLNTIREPFYKNFKIKAAEYGLATFWIYEEDGYYGFLELIIAIQKSIIKWGQT